MDFSFTLQKEEYRDYWACRMLGDPSFRKLRHRCWLILPGILLLLIAIFFPVPWWVWPLAVGGSLLWVLLVNYLVARSMKKAAAQRAEQAGDEAYQPLHVELKEGKLWVNNTRRRLKDYRIFSNLLLLFLEDSDCVILPQRVFGEGNESFRRVADALEQCLKKEGGFD